MSEEKKITVKVDRNEDFEKLKKDYDDLQKQLSGLTSLIAFEKLEEEKQRQEFEEKISPNPNHPPPSQGASLNYRESSSSLKTREFDSIPQLVNEIYKIANDRRNPQNREANEILDEWNKKAYEQIRTGRITRFSISQCPKCGGGYDDYRNQCALCGFRKGGQ